MPLLIVCPSGHRLKVPRKHAGHRIVCPVCDTSLLVPELNEEQSGTPRDQPPTPAAGPLLRPILPHSEPATPLAQPKNDGGAEAAEEEQIESPDQRNVVANPSLPSEAGRTIVEPTFPCYDTGDGFSATFVMPKDLPSLDSPFVPVVIEDQVDTSLSEKNFDREQRAGVWVLGIAAVAVALFGSMPSVLEQLNARQAGQNTVDTWTYVVLFAATIQLATAIYAMRLPDWSTSWVMSLVATGCAALYAIGLALTMFANQEHQLVRDLGLLDEAFHQRAQLWCFLVMCITLILAYSYGRFSLRWYSAERRLWESRVTS